MQHRLVIFVLFCITLITVNAKPNPEVNYSEVLQHVAGALSPPAGIALALKDSLNSNQNATKSGNNAQLLEHVVDVLSPPTALIKAIFRNRFNP